MSEVAVFESGATRNSDGHKYDFEGFLCPAVLERYGQYMHANRKQADGTLRASDNWQKGIPQPKYMSSLVRHTMDLWRLWDGWSVVDKDSGEKCDLETLCCAVMFNVMGLLHEELKKDLENEGYLASSIIETHAQPT